MLLSLSSVTKALALAAAAQPAIAAEPSTQDIEANNFGPTRNGYANKARIATNALNDYWYSSSSGLWNDLWWNSGNALTTIADFTKLSPRYALSTNSMNTMINTYFQAQQVDIQTTKWMDPSGLMKSKYCINGTVGDCGGKRDVLTKRRFKDFLNEYYDDEGWWALGLIHAYDVTSNRMFLNSAVTIFEDMQTGLGGPCNGGIFWKKDRNYVNAIANELYLSVAAALANRIPNDGKYLEIAKGQWEWFDNSGMINDRNLINDGLDDSCNNNNGITWSYNQGVVLGGLAELARATGDRGYLFRASTIAKAAIEELSNENGVLVEATACEYDPGRCGQDGQQFKGIFIRNLRYLHEVSPDAQFRDFILTNADAIWENDRNEENKLGVAWDGPYFDASGPSHSSALDVLVAAIAVA
jgi:predicted alpha-1,6-mannanase (GH76 family)